MAAEARAESPAPAPLPGPEKRAAPEDDGGEEERPVPKRRRAFVAAHDGVPCAAAAGEEGHGDGSSFSFHHARGGFVALETTPKFGSFKLPAVAEQEEEALDPKPAPPAGEDSPAAEEDEEDAASPRGVGDRKDGSSQLVAAEVDQGEPERQNESE